MNDFALLGAAGYVAPRHMRAIRDIGGNLKVAFDPCDSVGILDSTFPNASFFVEFERFDRHIDKRRRSGQLIEYMSICSPNYLHDAHVRFSLRSGAHAICEKPLVLNPWNLDGLEEISEQTGLQVNTILQLRLHPTVVKLRERVLAEPDKKHDVDLSYITSRGSWYNVSWKGDTGKSGGIATNIGIHFMDMLIYVYGDVQQSVLHAQNSSYAAGYLELERARVRWFLSIDKAHLPGEAGDMTTWRSILINGEELEFSTGFTDLHTESYKHIVTGNGFGIDQVRPSIELASAIRIQLATPDKEDQHPLLARSLK
jgi:UDP-N-acetyl-2-amino-2-deoxyglucuronate dehydrogenase